MRLIAIAIAIVAAVVAGPANAASDPAPQVSVDANGVAIRGYDPVAYFTIGRPTRGSPEHQLQWHGATWRFASATSLQAFQADPERYAPQFGGYCAWAVSQHYLAPGDPDQWKIVGGKLYLNFNARAKELWEADQVAAIKRGEANWPAVLADHDDPQ